LHIGALDHFLKHFDLCIFIIYLSLQIFQCGLGELPKFDLCLKQLFTTLIGDLSLASDLPLKIFDLRIFLVSLLFQLVDALVFVI